MVTVAMKLKKISMFTDVIVAINLKRTWQYNAYICMYYVIQDSMGGCMN